jgi:predicted RNA-binding Zn-ribbon protein involved in translation (DUF1610 family)
MDKSKLNAATRGINIPAHMQRLPINDKGYLVPWFVAKMGPNEWDFRAIHPGRVQEAVLQRLCWLCGQRIGMFKTFVAGPMCGVNRISSEPPSHKSCARYACQACPFMTKPKMVRNEKDMPEDAAEMPGITIKRNPGVTMLWTTKTFEVTSDPLFRMGPPTDVEWWCEGRRATREEVAASVESGLPILAATCEGDPECLNDLARYVAAFAPFMPKPEMADA